MFREIKKLAVDAVLFDLDGTLFEIIITADDVQNKNPHAEPLIMCSDKLGLVPGSCVYVGDTRVDIIAGKAAGMQTVAVLTGFDDYDALEREQPDAIIESVSDLKVMLFSAKNKGQRTQTDTGQNIINGAVHEIGISHERNAADNH